ncbi:MAG: RDD family protein [Azoarcus sp.]|nr:RDD family protein [Azoarcus sp.]
MPHNATPESALPAAPLSVELAGLRRRLASMLYESLLLLGVLAATFILPWMLVLWLLDVGNPPQWLGWLELLHVFAIFGAYFIWYWHRHGQTLAMQTWRLKVVAADDGRNPSMWRACLRYVLSWPSLLLCGVGIVWAIFDLDKLFLHDRLAGTRVVLLPPRR